MANDKQKLLKPTEVAELLKVHVEAILRLVRKEILIPWATVGEGKSIQYFWREQDLPKIRKALEKHTKQFELN